jgi:hypothetical protein
MHRCDDRARYASSRPGNGNEIEILGWASVLSLDVRAELLPNAVQRTKSACIIVNEEGPVCLEHEQTDSLREPGGQAAGVQHVAAGDKKAHGEDL